MTFVTDGLYSNVMLSHLCLCLVHITFQLTVIILNILSKICPQGLDKCSNLNNPPSLPFIYSSPIPPSLGQCVCPAVCGVCAP